MISRENVQRKIVVSCNVAERDVASVVAEIQKRVSEAVPLSVRSNVLDTTSDTVGSLKVPRPLHGYC